MNDMEQIYKPKIGISQYSLFLEVICFFVPFRMPAESVFYFVISSTELMVIFSFSIIDVMVIILSGRRHL